MQTKDKLSTEEIERVVNDLYVFYRVFVASNYKENQHAPHIKHISRYLMRQSLGDDECKRLCISCPPRSSKSSLVTIGYSIWQIFRNPSLDILVINASFALSEKFGIAIREIIREYGELFGYKLSQVKQSSTIIMLEDLNGKLLPGSIRLTSYNSQLTGMNCDVAIIDDYIKGLDDLTPTALAKSYEWYQAVFLQRLEPHSTVCLMATRWASNDLVGQVKKKFPNEYKLLSYPAILPNGEPLWKQRYTIEELEAKREQVGERMFQALYQQEPLDETSDFFDLSKIEFTTMDEIKDNPNTYGITTVFTRAWDIASGENVQDDYTAGAGMCLLSNKKVVIYDMIRGKFGNDNLQVIMDTADYTDPKFTTICIETGVGAAANLLYKDWSQHLRGQPVVQMKPMKSKVDRATPLKHAILDGKVIIAIEDEGKRLALLDEMRTFPLGEHDDQVDAVAHAFNYIYENYLQQDALVGTVKL